MAEPASHTAAAIAISGVSAGTLSAALGLDPTALFWAFLGAVCSRTIQPRISTLSEIIQAAGYAVISVVLGTLAGPFIGVAGFHYFDFLKEVGMQMAVALPAFSIALVGNEIVVRVVELIRTWRREAA